MDLVVPLVAKMDKPALIPDGGGWDRKGFMKGGKKLDSECI